jgi:hypothetical protein
MYNLEVARANSFSVGSSGWIVHNNGLWFRPCDPYSPESLAKRAKEVEENFPTAIRTPPPVPHDPNLPQLVDGRWIPPKSGQLPGLPDASPVSRKTPVQGGGGLRPRWKDPKGNIYEWDSQHGEVEGYNPRGIHQGAFDPISGAKIKEADPTRRIEP